MSRGMNKAERMEQLKFLYLQRGYTDAEMAERLGVDRTTAYRDRCDLEKDGYVFRIDEHGRYRLEGDSFISHVRLNLHEALALYLAARRASRQTHIAQPHAASALEKLAVALKQPMTGRLARSAGAILEQAAQPERVRVMETITLAWVERCKLRITYLALRARQPRQHVVHPYLIEPSLWSDGTYLIGYSEAHQGLATFKVERIAQAEKSLQQFEMPADFDEAALLRQAWGIWYGEGQPVRVRLRFRPGPAARRVGESIWHPNQKPLEWLEDGGCLWEAEVAEWQEMLPWARGWGYDVEVLEPQEMREAVVADVRRLARRYGVTTSIEVPRFFKLWAKADREQVKIHSLIYHLIDVASVAHLLWQQGLAPGERAALAQLLALPEDEAGRLLSFWIGLHDFGKASPEFQAQLPGYMPELRQVGLDFPIQVGVKKVYHSTITAWALPDLLERVTGLPRFWAVRIAHALGGHHGTWPTTMVMQGEFGPATVGERNWDALRKDLFTAFHHAWNPPPWAPPVLTEEQTNSFLVLFSGLTSVADWIGSMEVYFPYQDEPLDLPDYIQRSSQAAHNALEKLAWPNQIEVCHGPVSFENLFHFQPNAVQAQALNCAISTSAPALAILEAPTGIGKTEAALFLADQWLHAQQGRGLYIAMPTMATSNQMHHRTTRYLSSRYPGEGIQPLLLHSQAQWAVSHDTELPEIGESADEQTEAMTWFLPRKRSLLAPFAVGTVDQSFMSILQTRHFFVRLFGLAHKVVIFDEVHAYDTYMSSLFQRLLGWLRNLGTSVIVLSATLPEVSRQSFAAAWLNQRSVTLPRADYPRLTLINKDQITCTALPASAGKRVALEWIDPDPGVIVQQLKQRLEKGGCAVVLCNRVSRAQEVYRAIADAQIVPSEHLILFHARYPFVWRDAIEQRVLALFGKDGPRPERAIVVATQVIEQSLDLDFDLMISDLAPIDLLLQRAGRLHRHERPREVRPAPLHTPRLLITQPGMNQGKLEFGKDRWVYHPAILLRTWVTLQGRSELCTPEQTEALIEAVYGPVLPPASEELTRTMRTALAEFRQQNDEAVIKAANRMICKPHDEQLLGQRNDNLEEDNPAIAEAFRALTRDADQGIGLVCLHQVNGQIFDDPSSTDGMDLERHPTQEEVSRLLRCVVNVQHPGVRSYFATRSQPANWKKVAALRYHRPVVFVDGKFEAEDFPYILTLNRVLGLGIHKKSNL